MRKWLVILSIIFTIGFVSSAVLAERVYYEDLKVYTDYDKKELQTEALNNIYIESAVPVAIYPTADKPYIEFNQKFTDLIGAAPDYELSVDVKGDSTYINLDLVKDVFIWLGVKESEAQLTVYLPQSTINRLNIVGQDYYKSSRIEKRVINLEGINVNEFNADVSYGEFILSGNYEKVNISARGRLTLDSKSPAQVTVDGSIDQYLSGTFKKISVRGNNGRDIVIDSNSECQVDIASTNNSNIELRGKYSRIKMSGDSNTLDLHSDSICKLSTSGYDNNITANGPFSEMSFAGNSSSLDIQTTVIPGKIGINKGASNNKMRFTLPSNIPGFKIKYAGDRYMSEGDLEYYRDYCVNSSNLESDFNLNEALSSNELTYTYGDGGVNISLGMYNDNTLEIIDGGYSSNTAQ